MIYFTSLPDLLDDDIDPDAAFRAVSLKRNAPLDLLRSPSFFDRDKMFLARETGKGIILTRLHTFFEQMLPKYIVCLDTKSGRPVIRVRYSLLPFLLIVLLGFSLASSISDSIGYGYADGDILFISLSILLFALLSYIEFRLLKRAIAKAMQIHRMNMIGDKIGTV